MLVVLVPVTSTPASGMVSLAEQVYFPLSLVCRVEKLRKGGDEVASFEITSPSLVHISLGVPPISSGMETEQISVRDSPAILVLLKGDMLTTSGEGAALEGEGMDLLATHCGIVTFLWECIIPPP